MILFGIPWLLPVIVGALFFYFTPITRTVKWLKKRQNQQKAALNSSKLLENAIKLTKIAENCEKVGHIDPVLAETDHKCEWPNIVPTWYYDEDIKAGTHRYKWQPGDICACKTCGEQRILVYIPKEAPFFIPARLIW